MTMDKVVSITCLRGTSKAEEWNPEMLQTGDIVEELRIGRGSVCVRAPFSGGKRGVEKLLHMAYKQKETSIAVRVRRRTTASTAGGSGHDELVELHACVVPDHEGVRKHYILRCVVDPNYAVGFCDRTVDECFELQGTRSKQVVSALDHAKLRDGYVAYPWELTMKDHLPIHDSSCFLSLLVMPFSPDHTSVHFNDLDDTLARTNAWLRAAQASGVPILSMNVQTEVLLTKVSGERASSAVNPDTLWQMTNVANGGLYGFEDYLGIDIGVIRAVRLWYSPVSGEIPLLLEPSESDAKLGFSVSRTVEGFVYISSVSTGDGQAESVAQRSGLGAFYKSATEASKLLVVSRISHQKVLPWVISSAGGIRCYDTVSISQKLSLYRHACKPFVLHIFLWSRMFEHQVANEVLQIASARPTFQMPTTSVRHEAAMTKSHQDDPDADGSTSVGSSVGDVSFRLQDLSFLNEYV